MHRKYEMNNNLMVCNSHSHITKFNNDYDQYHHSYVVSISKCWIQYLDIIYLDYQHQHDHLGNYNLLFWQYLLSYIHEKNT